MLLSLLPGFGGNGDNHVAFPRSGRLAKRRRHALDDGRNRAIRLRQYYRGVGLTTPEVTIIRIIPRFGMDRSKLGRFSGFLP